MLYVSGLPPHRFSPERERFVGPPSEGRFGPPLHPLERGEGFRHPRMLDGFEPMDPGFMPPPRDGFVDEYDLPPVPYDEFPLDRFDPRGPPDEFLDPRDPRLGPPLPDRDFFPPHPDMFGPRLPGRGPPESFGHRGIMGPPSGKFKMDYSKTLICTYFINLNITLYFPSIIFLLIM
jgi:hypothetical protein